LLKHIGIDPKRIAIMDFEPNDEARPWCHDRGVLYINTSVELRDPCAGTDNKHPPSELSTGGT